MNNKFSFLLSKFNVVAAIAALLLAIPITGFTQSTTSSIRGQVNDSDGNALSSAAVIGAIRQ